MGGSGDYFDSANCVIAMDSFLPKEVTQKAKQIVKDNPTERKIGTRFSFPAIHQRFRDLTSLSFRRGNKECLIQTRELMTLIICKTEIDVQYLEHLIEEGQLEICGWIMKKIKDKQKQEDQQILVAQEITSFDSVVCVVPPIITSVG